MGIQAALPNFVDIDQLDFFWSAITVGRPYPIFSVLPHGRYSIDEILWRNCIIDANVTKLPDTTALYNSPAFDALDMTEKGWVNYSLGMVFTKLVAAKLFSMPWLFHYKWFARHGLVTTLPGGSTPDFVGFDPTGPHYHSLEAKGRNSGFSQKVMAMAKAQAAQAFSVNGQPCGLHIGALLYRLGANRLAMAMADPEPEGVPIELNDRQETWSEYYRVAWGLVKLDDEGRRALEAMLGISVELDPGARPFIEQLMQPDNKKWEQARDGLIDWSARSDGSLHGSSDEGGLRTFRDGIRIGYKPPPIFIRMRLDSGE